MKPKFKFLIPIILVTIMLPLVRVGAASAQSPIWAEVDRATLSTDETLILTVTINSSSILNAPRPTLPSLQGFTIVGSSSSTQVSIVNADITTLAVTSYRLQPYETGDLTIEPINVTIGGQTYQTEPITVQVTQGSGAPAAVPAPSNRGAAVTPTELSGQDLFVEAEVDNPTPYVGQQVVHTFRFYRAINLWDQPQFEARSFTGFWNEQQLDQQEYQVQAAGRIYRVTEIQTILFPTAAGPVTIDPARIMVPGGFFSRGQTLQTRPIELNVQPLPANAPAGFGGAVGQFALEASMDITQSKVNEPLTWKIILHGRGNINAAPDPVWPEMPGWRDFESEATVNTGVRDGFVVGNRAYERLLVPSNHGELTIPALEYIYFDPASGQYQTIHTEPIPVSIAPGDANAAAYEAATGNLPAAVDKETVEQLTTDIRHLKPAPAEMNKVEQPVTASALYWAAWIFPVFGAVGYFVWQKRQRFWERNLGLARSSQARKKAKKALAQARRQKQDSRDAAGQILMAYLSDKLDRPVAGLTHQTLAEQLAEHGVKPDLVERVQVLLVSSELGRYAPGADDPGHAENLLRETSRLINALEKVSW